MTDEKHLREVKKILRGRVGRENAITSREINEKLGGIDTLDSTPHTRSLIRELVNKHGVPIAASPNGYYIIGNEAELHEYVTKLEERIAGIEKRKQSIIEAYEHDSEEAKKLTEWSE